MLKCISVSFIRQSASHPSADSSRPSQPDPDADVSSKKQCNSCTQFIKQSSKNFEI